MRTTSSLAWPGRGGDRTADKEKGEYELSFMQSRAFLKPGARHLQSSFGKRVGNENDSSELSITTAQEVPGTLYTENDKTLLADDIPLHRWNKCAII
jgi:hypothetical protein